MEPCHGLAPKDIRCGPALEVLSGSMEMNTRGFPGQCDESCNETWVSQNESMGEEPLDQISKMSLKASTGDMALEHLRINWNLLDGQGVKALKYKEHHVQTFGVWKRIQGVKKKKASSSARKAEDQADSSCVTFLWERRRRTLIWEWSINKFPLKPWMWMRILKKIKEHRKPLILYLRDASSLY